MNAATYTAVTAASDSSSSATLSGPAAVIVCVICLGLIAGIVLLCSLGLFMSVF